MQNNVSLYNFFTDQSSFGIFNHPSTTQDQFANNNSGSGLSAPFDFFASNTSGQSQQATADFFSSQPMNLAGLFFQIASRFKMFLNQIILLPLKCQ